MTGIIHEKDRYGNDLYFADGGDIRYPPFPLIDDYRKHIENLRHMPLRDDDVILVGYPKSGFHWHREVVHMLLNGSADHVTREAHNEFLDCSPEWKLPPPDKPRVFFSCFRFHHLPLAVTEKKIKLIHLTRNPKDVFVSAYNQVYNVNRLPPFKGTWAQWFELMMANGFWSGNWFDHVLDWEREITAHPHLPIMQCSFEDLKRQPTEQIMKINQFLGLNRGRQLCEQIAQACEFSTLKKVKDTHTTDSIIWTEGSSGYYRKGEIGDWKNWFTVAQNEQFDDVFQRRMAASRLTFTFV